MLSTWWYILDKKQESHERKSQHWDEVETTANCCQLHTHRKWGTREMHAPNVLTLVTIAKTQEKNFKIFKQWFNFSTRVQSKKRLIVSICQKESHNQPWLQSNSLVNPSLPGVAHGLRFSTMPAYEQLKFWALLHRFQMPPGFIWLGKASAAVTKHSSKS